MKTVTLTAFVDEMTGTLGLGIDGMPRTEETNAANEGLSIAHDLIEHVNGVAAIGSIDDELEALGAIWYVRGQWGTLRRDNVGGAFTIYENIAADITRMFRDFFYGAHVNKHPPRTKPCEADDDLSAVVCAAVKGLRDELDDTADEATIAQREKEYIAVCLPRMRLGYRKAKQRYEKLGRFAANNLFWAITEAVDPYCKSPEYEGQRFKLRYGFREGEAIAFCEEDYSDY